MSTTRDEKKESKSELISHFESILKERPAKAEKIKPLLTDALLKEVNEKKQNIVHIAAEFATDEVFKLVCETVKKKGKRHLFKNPDIRRNTPLHIAASKNSFQVVSQLLKTLGSRADHVARTLNNDNKYPVNLVPANSEEMENLLEEYMQKTDMKPLTDLISEEEVLAENKEAIQANPALKERFQWVVSLMNMTRSPFIYSETHLNAERSSVSINSLKESQQPKISKIMEAAKNELEKLTDSEINDELIQKVININKKFLSDVYESNYIAFANEKNANCGQLAQFSLRNAKHYPPPWLEKGKFYVIEIISLKNGDHNFNIFGRDPVSGVLDFETCIVGDPWAGFVCLLANLPKYLKNYRSHNDKKTNQFKFRVVGFWNPDIQLLESIGSNLLNIEVLQGIDHLDRKKFLLKTDENNRNELHRIMQSTPVEIKIYFKYIEEMKDEKYARYLLSLKSTQGKTALDEIMNRGEKTVRFVFGEYRKYFQENFSPFLLGNTGKDLGYLEDALKNRNKYFIEELFRACNNAIIRTQFTLIFIRASRTPELASVMRFMLRKYQRLFTTDLLQNTFLQSKTPVKKTHCLLWKECKKRLSEDEQDEILTVHPHYRPLALEFKKAKEIKATAMRYGLFTFPPAVQQKLANFPDHLSLDDRMNLTITPAEIYSILAVKLVKEAKTAPHTIRHTAKQ